MSRSFGKASNFLELIGKKQTIAIETDSWLKTKIQIDTMARGHIVAFQVWSFMPFNFIVFDNGVSNLSAKDIKT